MIWMETISKYSEREGLYLICPIHAPTKPNYCTYKVLTELQPGEMVFHCLLERVTKTETMITSFSRVADRFYVQEAKDPLCDHLPPYRKILLVGNHKLNVAIPVSKLVELRGVIETIDANADVSRTPFDKNFRMKQLYLSRLPEGYMPLFRTLSQTSF